MFAICLRLRNSFLKLNSYIYIYICSAKQTKQDENEEERREGDSRDITLDAYSLLTVGTLCSRIEMVIKINCKHMNLFLTTTTLWKKIALKTSFLVMYQ